MPDLSPHFSRTAPEDLPLVGHAVAGLVEIPVAGAAADEDLPLEIRPVPGEGLITPDGMDLEGFEVVLHAAELAPAPEYQFDLPDLEGAGRELAGKGHGTILRSLSFLLG
jgi:hypothetical protein